MYLIGIDVGGMSIKGGIVDSETGKILVQHAIPTTAQYTIFSGAHKIFSQMDNLLSHKASLNKFKKLKS